MIVSISLTENICNYAVMCAWLMFSEEVDLKIAFKNLKSKRNVVSSAILNYTVLHELEREFATTSANNKNRRITRRARRVK